MVELLEEIEKLGLKKTFKKEEHLFYAGDEVAGFFYVLSGEISVYKMDEQGKEIEITHLNRGNFLGEAVIFTADIYPVFARVIKDVSVLYFSKSRVINEIDRNIKVAKFFLNLLAKKCLILNKRIETLSMKSVRQRLIQYLLSLCKQDGKCLIQLKIKKGEIAKLLGTINETLSRNLRQLQDERLITVEGSNIRVNNCVTLKNELSKI